MNKPNELIINIITIVEKHKGFHNKLIDLLNQHNLTISDGALMLIFVATKHLKDAQISKNNFLQLCEILYDGARSSHKESKEFN